MTDPTPVGETPIGDALLSSLDAEAGQVTPTPAQEAPTAPEPAQASPEPVAPAAEVPTPPVLVVDPTPVPVSELVAASLAARATTDQKTITPGNVGVSTQVANPRRAAWRTVVQSIVGILIVAVPLANAVLANLSDYLHAQHDLAVAPWVFVVVNGALAVTAFVIGLVARLMATPGVASFIARYLPFLAPIKGQTKA